MTRVDFHVNAPTKVGYTCRLVRRARAAGSQVVIFDTDASHLAELDRQLWTFSAQDFLPHCYAGDALAAQTPILLTADAHPTPHHDLLINLDAREPEFFSRFERLIEVVDCDPEDRLRARNRWKFYKDRGYPLTHHDLAPGAT